MADAFARPTLASGHRVELEDNATLGSLDRVVQVCAVDDADEGVHRVQLVHAADITALCVSMLCDAPHLFLRCQQSRLRLPPPTAVR